MAKYPDKGLPVETYLDKRVRAYVISLGACSWNPSFSKNEVKRPLRRSTASCLNRSDVIAARLSHSVSFQGNGVEVIARYKPCNDGTMSVTTFWAKAVC